MTTQNSLKALITASLKGVSRSVIVQLLVHKGFNLDTVGFEGVFNKILVV